MIRGTVRGMSSESTLAPFAPIRDLVQHLLPECSDVALDHLALDADGLTLALAATPAVASCPSAVSCVPTRRAREKSPPSACRSSPRPTPAAPPGWTSAC